MIQYQNLIRRILDEGIDVPDRTGVGTRSIFGHQMRFHLSEGFPLVTLKKTGWKGAFTELLWMLRGDTNIAWLNKHGVHIWDEWADTNGDLGPIYGHQWRHWGGHYGTDFGGIDQINALAEGLRSDPHGRRHILTAWNPEDLPEPGLRPELQPPVGRMALAPCHCLAQFYVGIDGLGRDRLSCQLYQRSADTFLGVPYNLAGYALLTELLAYKLHMTAGDLIWTGGDVHIYQNHLDKARQLLQREPRLPPKLILHHNRSRRLDEIQPEELNLLHYDPHPAIRAEVAV